MVNAGQKTEERYSNSSKHSIKRLSKRQPVTNAWSGGSTERQDAKFKKQEQEQTRGVFQVWKLLSAHALNLRQSQSKPQGRQFRCKRDMRQCWLHFKVPLVLQSLHSAAALLHVSQTGIAPCSCTAAHFCDATCTAGLKQQCHPELCTPAVPAAQHLRLPGTA